MLTGGGSSHIKGKTLWTEGDGNPGTLKWREYPTPTWWGGKERIFKGKCWRMSVDYGFLDPLLLGEAPCFTFTFCFPNKSLLNSLTIFLSFNFLSSEEKEPISLDDLSILVPPGDL
jgi:hypothetical protein